MTEYVITYRSSDSPKRIEAGTLKIRDGVILFYTDRHGPELIVPVERIKNVKRKT